MSAHPLPHSGPGAVGSVRQRAQSVFTHLVMEGRKVERRERDLLTSRLEAIRQTARSLGTVVGDRVESACSALLHRVGLPTRAEIADLTRRMESLQKRIEDLT